MKLTAPLRPILAVLGFAVLVAALSWGTAGPVLAAIEGDATFDQLVAAIAAVAAWVLAGWILLATVATAAATVPGRIGRAALLCADRITPVAARHMIRASVGVVTVAVPYAATVPAVAAPDVPVAAQSATAPADPARNPDELAEGLRGIGRPPVDRPTVTVTDEPRPGKAHTEPAPREPRQPADTTREKEKPPKTQARGDRRGAVTVRAGDTLWDIAARHLGPHASAPDIAQEWPRWYTANRDVIGADPDLIHPGMRLHPPGER